VSFFFLVDIISSNGHTLKSLKEGKQREDDEIFHLSELFDKSKNLRNHGLIEEFFS
jgi:hypothetical protein